MSWSAGMIVSGPGKFESAGQVDSFRVGLCGPKILSQAGVRQQIVGSGSMGCVSAKDRVLLGGAQRPPRHVAKHRHLESAQLGGTLVGLASVVGVGHGGSGTEHGGKIVRHVNSACFLARSGPRCLGRSCQPPAHHGETALSGRGLCGEYRRTQIAVQSTRTLAQRHCCLPRCSRPQRMTANLGQVCSILPASELGGSLVTASQGNPRPSHE